MSQDPDAQRHPAMDDGVVFPRTHGQQRSTSETGRAIFADALRVVDRAGAEAIERQRQWRTGYIAHARRLVEVAAGSPLAAKAIAVAGLRAVHRRLHFERAGEVRGLDSALDHPRARYLTRTVTGISKAGPAPLAVPYRGQVLSGDSLRRQIDRWEADGLCEPSFAQALWRVQANAHWLDLSDQRFALLGAQAEMGPLPWLLRWRATVYAVDLARADIWHGLMKLAHAGNGTLCMPCSADPGAAASPQQIAQHAGADLIRDTPEIAAWLADSDGALTVGAYGYLDGAHHVRVAAAMDAIQAALTAQRGNVSLAMLATPTDAYAVPAAPLQAARQRFAGRGRAARAARIVTLGHGFACNGTWLDGTPHGAPQPDAHAVPAGIIDALVTQQGPNYVLAKRVQHWRALVARATGTRVSIHVAPPALTRSVTSNKLIAAAYRAADRFGVQAFEPATAAALMAALLVHDLRNPQAVANPAVDLAHPLQLLSEAACHGGLWRMPYSARSALPMAAAIGMLQR